MATTETNPFQPLRRWSLFRRVAWRRRDAIGGIVISLLVAGLGFLTTLGGFLGSSFAWFIALRLVLQVGVLLAFPLWLVRRRGYAPIQDLGQRASSPREFLIAVPLAVGVLISAGLVASLARTILIALRRPAQSPLDFWGRLSMREAIAISIMAVALAPLAEEIFFRGYIYNSLRRICPMWIALAAQACFSDLATFTSRSA